MARTRFTRESAIAYLESHGFRAAKPLSSYQTATVKRYAAGLQKRPGVSTRALRGHAGTAEHPGRIRPVQAGATFGPMQRAHWVTGSKTARGSGPNRAGLIRVMERDFPTEFVVLYFHGVDANGKALDASVVVSREEALELLRSGADMDEIANELFGDPSQSRYTWSAVYQVAVAAST